MLVILPVIGIILIFGLVVFIRGGAIGKAVVVISVAFILHVIFIGSIVHNEPYKYAGISLQELRMLTRPLGG